VLPVTSTTEVHVQAMSYRGRGTTLQHGTADPAFSTALVPRPLCDSKATGGGHREIRRVRRYTSSGRDSAAGVEGMLRMHMPLIRKATADLAQMEICPLPGASGSLKHTGIHVEHGFVVALLPISKLPYCFTA